MATPAPRSEDAIVLEGMRAGKPCFITIEFQAIEELRALAKDPQQVAAGVVRGALSEDRVVLQHCEAASPSDTAIGIFRTQCAGWPAVTEPDCSRLQTAFAGKSAAVLLVVRTLAQRPWSATLFLVHPKQPQLDERALVEFPFDAYLLRNGWLTDLAPPAPFPARHAPVSRTRRRGPWLATAIAAGVLAGGGTAVFESTWRPWSKAAVSGGAPALKPAVVPPIGLRAVRSLDEMEVSWDRGSEVVRAASGGTLVIHNGPVTRSVPLNADQLREGRVTYRPVSGVDADFRLELTMPDGRIETESIQALGFDTSPSLTLPVAAKPRPKSQPHSADRKEVAAVTRTERPDAAPPTEPQPVKRVNPLLNRDVMEEMRRANGLVTISVLVNIDAAGKVDTARVVGSTGEPSPSGSHMRLAALNAAKQWRFRPATSGGKAVPSTLTLAFSF